MEPKITAEEKLAPVPPGELPGFEIEVWEPPFERWMRIADNLLGRGSLVLPKAIPGGPKTLNQ